jgi:hypothetical protein
MVSAITGRGSIGWVGLGALLLLALALAPGKARAGFDCIDCPPDPVRVEFMTLRGAIVQHVAGPRQASLVRRASLAERLYFEGIGVPPNPVVPPNPIAPVAVVVSIDVEVAALACAGGVTPAGAAAIRASAGALLALIAPALPRLIPVDPCRRG